MRAPAASPIFFQSSALHGSISSVLFPLKLTRTPFVCFNALVNAFVTACAEFEVVESSSKSSNGVTTIECRASSVFWTIDDKRELVIAAIAPIAPRTTAAPSELASFGLRFDQRQMRTGGETGRAMIGRPSSQRSRSSAKSPAV